MGYGSGQKWARQNTYTFIPIKLIENFVRKTLLKIFCTLFFSSFLPSSFLRVQSKPTHPISQHSVEQQMCPWIMVVLGMDASQYSLYVVGFGAHRCCTFVNDVAFPLKVLKMSQQDDECIPMKGADCIFLLLDREFVVCLIFCCTVLCARCSVQSRRQENARKRSKLHSFIISAITSNPLRCCYDLCAITCDEKVVRDYFNFTPRRRKKEVEADLNYSCRILVNWYLSRYQPGNFLKGREQYIPY